jgi:hypothetical protein
MHIHDNYKDIYHYMYARKQQINKHTDLWLLDFSQLDLQGRWRSIHVFLFLCYTRPRWPSFNS